MKRIIVIFSMWCAITFIGTFYGRSCLSSETQYFKIARYRKAIVSDGRLYMSTRQKMSSGLYMTNFRAMSLTGNVKLQILPFYPGVYIERESELEGNDELSPAAKKYPLCWDITSNYVLSIYFMEFLKVPWPGIQAVGIDVDILKVRPPENIDDYLITSLIPITKVFREDSFRNLHRNVSFDVVAISERIFDLYIACEGMMVAWHFDETSETSMKTGLKRIINGQSREAEVTGWEQRHSWPIDFEGPFHIIRLREDTYLFSEQTGMVSLLEEQSLRPIAQIPQTRNQEPGEKYLIVDKDYGQLHIVVSPVSQPENLTFLTIGDTRSLRQGLESAFRSAVELSERSAQ